MGWKKATEDVVIWVRCYDEEEKARFANPQSFLYFYILYSITAFLIFPLMVAPHALGNKKQTPPSYSFFMMMTITSLSMAVLASCILIFASFFLQTWMKDIHYTILKSTGCFFAMLALFSLGVAVLLPHDHLNWIVLSVICVIILVLYYFLWKYVCTYQQDLKHMNRYRIHWSESLTVLAPLSVVLPPNLPPWAQTTFVYVCFYVLAAALYINACTRVISRRKNKLCNLGTSRRSDPDYINQSSFF
ncbi:hypothetical protein CTI12_AA054400 [Artemisia annua]|uniref:Uncharacterized protein n=1 Tax=Artemisia annua TaxID=35608 RepID=A0A2U1QAH9_ARTAN|nr:hypothetical protein CTI12_AA054400 [Artemisia annua]